MIKNEDEKLSQILVKIEQQKKALEKHLRSEVFALELHKKYIPFISYSIFRTFIFFFFYQMK